MGRIQAYVYKFLDYFNMYALFGCKQVVYQYIQLFIGTCDKFLVQTVRNYACYVKVISAYPILDDH